MLSHISTIEPGEEGMYTDFQHQCDRELRILHVPEGVKKIGHGAFAFCSNLEEVILPEGLEEIGMLAFYGCDKLRKVILPGTVRVIGCDGFPRIDIDVSGIPDNDDSFARIFDYATLSAAGRCYYCHKKVAREHAYRCECGKKYSGIHRNRAPEVASIAHFRENPMGTGNLYAANDIMLEEDSPDKKFFRALWLGYPPIDLSRGREYFCYLRELTLVTWRSAHLLTFSSCPMLYKVTLSCPIHPYMFAGCLMLREVNLSDSIDRIPEGAFANCNRLESIYIPECVKEISPLAFQGCENLRYAMVPSHLRRKACFPPCTSVQYYTPEK